MGLVVKVGNRPSRLRFNNYKAIRAIDIDDIKDAVAELDCHVIVIENIKEEEKKDFEDFISEFIKDENNKVLYYIESEDDYTTMGIADKFEHDIYFNDDIYIQLSHILGQDIMPRMRVNGLEEYNKLYTKVEEEVEETDNKYIEGEEGGDNSSTNNTDDLFSNNISINDITTNIEINDREERIIDENDVDTSRASEYIENTGSNDKELEDKYNNAIEDIKKAYNRIDSLENVISNLTKEKKIIEEKFKGLLISDNEIKVIEKSSVNVDDYNTLKKSKSELDKKIIAISNTLEDVKNDNNNLTSILNNLKQDKIDLTEDNEKLNNKIDELNAQIDSLTTNIEEISYKNTELEAINKDLVNDNKDTSDIKKELNEKKVIIDKLNDDNNNLQNYLNQEIVYREKTDELIRERTTVLIDVLTRIDELEKLNNQLTELNTNYKDNINKLEERIGSIDTKESVSLKAQLKLVTGQLNSMTTQYNNLIAMTGSDEKGLKRMLDRTEQIETLNEKLSNNNKELEKNLDDVVGERDRLQVEVKQLRAKFGGVNINSNNDIKYKPKSRIISLFGYGSTGVTTTAVSLAYKLYNTANVLIIDWDLVNPKMNQWFGINELPLCKIKGFSERDIRTTSLGMFYSSGVDICKTNISKLVKTIQNTKGGKIDYFSGLYYNVENTELINANYNEFIKFIDGLGYEYIIIDFGRLSADKSMTDIIQRICNVSYKTIVVTDNDNNDITNFRTRLKLAKFDLNKIQWFVNKCNNKVETNNLATKLGNKITFMMFESELVGKKISFNSIMSTRTKFNNEIALQLLEV